MKILISDPDYDWVKTVEAQLARAAFEFKSCFDGKETQLSLFQQSYDVLLLDYNLRNNSSFEVLKYLKLNKPRVKIIFTLGKEDQIGSDYLDQEDFRKLGVSDMLVKPYSMETLMECLENELGLKTWKKLTLARDKSPVDITINESDEEFTPVHVTDFCCGNSASFDHYLRLGQNRYVKILHQGEKLDPERLKNFVTNHKAERLYFKTKDRLRYINFLNEILSKMIDRSGSLSGKEVSITRTATNMYIDEVYTAGLNAKTVEEGIKLCRNMYELVEKDRHLRHSLKQYQELNPSSQDHAFLTTFFSILIANNLEWSSSRTVNVIAMGALFHDIGFLKVPKELHSLKPDEMTKEQRITYERHPILGAELLESCPSITEPVMQIVLQHHETADGKGFPLKLTGTKIYPQARIVGLADTFSDLLVTEKVPPVHGLRLLLKDINFVQKYEAGIIRGLINAYTKPKA